MGKIKDFIKKDEFGQADAFDDLLNTNVTKKADAKSKKKNGEILPVAEDIQSEIDNLIAAKKAKKTAESNIAKAEPKIIEFGINLKDQNAFSGKFQKSYKLGTEDSHVNFITANKWSFKEDDVDEIKNIIEGGEGNPDDFLNANTEVKLKAEVFKDEKLKAKFVKMVGKEFPEFFETVKYHTVDADFDEKVYTLGEGAYEDLKLLMKQSKPSLR